MSGRDPDGPPGQGRDRPGGRGPPDENPGKGRGPPGFAAVRYGKRAVERTLLQKKHVHAVAVGRKYVDGRKTDDLAIIVHVTDKVPEDELQESDRIPRRIKIAGQGEVKTDVKESPIPEPESSAVASRGGPHRPLFGGIKVSMQGRNSYLSIGCFVETAAGNLRLLTNRHIVGGDVENPPTGGEVITQPVDDTEPIGQLEEWSDWTVDGENTSDSALISLDTGIEAANHVMSIGPVGPPTQASLGDAAVNSGARTHGVASIVDEVDYSGYINFDPSILFVGLIAFRPHTTNSGDSGSMWGIYDDATSQVHPVGLNFAGGGSSNASLAIPWSALEAEHGQLSAPSPGLVTDVVPRNTTNKTEVLPYELETGERAILHCLAARYGDPASPAEEPIELYDGPVVDGEPTGTVIGQHRLETAWGEVAEIQFKGLVEKLGVGTHTVTLYTIGQGPREYQITIAEPTEHRFYGTVTTTSGEVIADASVDTYRQ